MKILHRAKRRDNKQWAYWNVYGVYTKPFHTKSEAHGDVREYDIIPETVGQYTGLEDKNGVEIFEGDIIKDRWKGLGIVEYSENNGCWLSIPCEDGLYQCFKDGDISESDCSNFNVLMQQGEVIGNIHNNPELLK